MDVSTRGETVLAELKLLVLLSQEYSVPESDNMDVQTTVATPQSNNTVIINEPHVSSAPVKFPRSRTRSTTLGGRKSLAASDRTDENSLYLSPTRAPLGIARTVRRTLSGGLTSILRPFQPSLTKNHADEPDAHLRSKEGRSLKKAVSTSFAKPLEPESETNRHHSRKGQALGKGSKPGSLRVRTTKARARESVCSRNSTISIMEYLASRKHQEDSGKEEHLVPLSEYGRNCHLYGCDSPHIWNPDKNSSCLVIHCDCDIEDRSTAHVHIDETPLFYRPGSSTATIHANPALNSCASSLAENYTEFTLRPARPSNPASLVESAASISGRD